MFGKQIVRALTLATIVSLLMSSVALADTIENNVVSGGNDTIVVGGSTTITYKVEVQGTGTDGQGGCNASDGSPLNVTIAVPAGVTASASSMQFTACSTSGAKQVTFSSSTAGTYAITHSYTDAGPGAYTNLANWTLKVNAATPTDTTAPVVTPTVVGTLGGGGWYTSNVSLSWSVTDGQSPISASSGCGTTSITADQGATTYTCTATSAGGTTSQSVSIKMDKTAPVVNPASVVNSTWRNSDLSQAFTASDPLSGLAVTADASFTLTASTESANATTPTIATKTVTDVAGNSTTRSVSALIDLTAPVITDEGFVSGTAGANGWYTSAVVNKFAASDARSGLASGVVTPFNKSSGSDEGSAVKIDSGAVADAAANSNSGIDSVAYKIDLTAPTITFVSRTAANAAGWNNTDVTVTWSCSDSGSGVVDATATQTLTTEAADQTATGTCTDNAGRTASDSVSNIDIDMTAPVVNPASVVNSTWRNSDLSQAFLASDALSGLAVATDDSFTLTASTESTKVEGIVYPTIATKTVTDVAGNSTTRSVSAFIDLTDPTISGAVSPPAPAASGWYVTAPTVTFTCGDGLSGPASCLADRESTSSKTLGESATAQSVTGTATDIAGNDKTATISGLKVDLTNPTNIAFVGGPAAGSSHYFGSVPAAPTCTADDAISGLKDCVVSGYGTTVGTHTMTATATDNAGRTATATRTYTVSAWTLKGFYSPVDMNGTVNTVKGGSTVPLKFEVFVGGTELTSTDAIKSFGVTKISCDAGAQADEIELTTTGGTSLRYDTTGGQFIQNWKTPTGSACYRVTMTTTDGSTIVALFKTR